MTTATKIECKPLRGLHAIDRRDYVKDERGNYLLVKGEKQLNWTCVCGKTSAHSADYRGGEFVFIHDDEEAEQHKVVAE